MKQPRIQRRGSQSSHRINIANMQLSQHCCHSPRTAGNVVPCGRTPRQTRPFITSKGLRAQLHTSLPYLRMPRPTELMASSELQAATTPRGTIDQGELTTAWSYLKEFSLKTFRGLSAPYTATVQKREELRNALQMAYRNPWPAAGWTPPQPAQPEQPQSDACGSVSPPLVMIGLMAGDVRMGARAMRDYCVALGVEYTKPESRVQGNEVVANVKGPVYMKYNSLSKVCYVSNYLGKERGVLLQLGTEQLGHFPLGLFDEEMKAPPPPL